MPNTGGGTSHIYYEIYRRIAEYEYRPGERIIEHQLIDEFGTSRTPIRDALIRLSAEGLVNIIPNSGTFINKLSFHELFEVYEIRSHLVDLVGQLAAKRIRSDELAEFHTLVTDISKEEDFQKIIHLDARCHQLIDGASRNKELRRLMDNLKVRCFSIWEFHMSEEVLLTFKNDFFDLFHAFERRDALESGQILKKHVQRIVSSVLSRL